MVMDITWLKDIAYLILFAISVYGWWKNGKEDTIKQTEQFVKVNWKLDSLCQAQTDIKDEIRDLKKSSSDTDKRLTVIEEQIKVANHRIDDLERGGNSRE